jgi:hypothetical protein
VLLELPPLFAFGPAIRTGEAMGGAMSAIMYSSHGGLFHRKGGSNKTVISADGSTEDNTQGLAFITCHGGLA